MSKDKTTLQLPEIGDDSRDQPYRRSLQSKGTTEGSTLRHTQSQNYGAKKKKVVKVPTIPEDSSKEVKISVEIDNEVKTVDKERKHRQSRGSRKSSQASSRLGFDNAAFEVEDGFKISRGNSAASSIRSSMRDPSVQSLTVVREQYCCYAKWTPCERALFAAVCVLSFIVIVLVVVIVLVAKRSGNDDNDNANNSTQSIFSLFDFTEY